jgi:hypothetical protein
MKAIAILIHHCRWVLIPVKLFFSQVGRIVQCEFGALLQGDCYTHKQDFPHQQLLSAGRLPCECEVNLKGVATGRSFLLKLTTHGVSGLAPQAACSTCMELAHSHRNSGLQSDVSPRRKLWSSLYTHRLPGKLSKSIFGVCHWYVVIHVQKLHMHICFGSYEVLVVNLGFISVDNCSACFVY